MRNKVLVTGASGFVGSSLCVVLQAKGVEVIGVGRTRPKEWLGEFLELDLTALSDFSALLQDVKAVVHLASRVHMGDETGAVLLPIYRKINTEATLNLATQAKRSGVERFVYMSSVKAVGEKSLTEPLRVGDEPRPLDPYGISKLESEDGLQRLVSEGFQVAILRPPLVYGPGVKANFYALMNWVRKGVPLPLGNIRNRRSLIFVGNLISVIEACLTAKHVSPTPYFVADTEVFSTPGLIRTIAEAFGAKARIWSLPVSLLVFIGKLVGQSSKVARLTESLELDTSEFCQDFSWIPPYTAQQGIKETAKWMQSH